MAASDWVPLYQDLVWPAFVLVVIVLFQRPLRRTLGPLLQAVGQRIGSGADLSVGKDGLKITGGPKLDAPAAEPPAPTAGDPAGESRPSVTAGPSVGPEAPRKNGGRKRHPQAQKDPAVVEVSQVGPRAYSSRFAASSAAAIRSSEALHPGIYLVHRARRMGGTRDDPRYEVTIALDTDDISEMGRVEKVVYHLHRTFRRPTREVTSRSDNFELVLPQVWGQFMVYADVHFNDGTPSLQLTRYLNF